MSDRALRLRQLRILILALVLGPMVFLVTVVIMAQLGVGVRPELEQSGGDPLELISMLSAFNAFLAPACWTAAGILYPRLLATKPSAPLGDEIATRIRSATIVSLALCEGAALFGVLAIFLAHLHGVLPENPIVWANTIPLLGLLGAAAAVFPTERTCEELEQQQADPD